MKLSLLERNVVLVAAGCAREGKVDHGELHRSLTRLKVDNVPDVTALPELLRGALAKVAEGKAVRDAERRSRAGRNREAPTFTAASRYSTNGTHTGQSTGLPPKREEPSMPENKSTATSVSPMTAAWAVPPQVAVIKAADEEPKLTWAEGPKLTWAERIVRDAEARLATLTARIAADTAELAEVREVLAIMKAAAADATQTPGAVELVPTPEVEPVPTEAPEHGERRKYETPESLLAPVYVNADQVAPPTGYSEVIAWFVADPKRHASAAEVIEGAGVDRNRVASALRWAKNAGVLDTTGKAGTRLSRYKLSGYAPVPPTREGAEASGELPEGTYTWQQMPAFLGAGEVSRRKAQTVGAAKAQAAVAAVFEASPEPMVPHDATQALADLGAGMPRERIGQYVRALAAAGILQPTGKQRRGKTQDLGRTGHEYVWVSPKPAAEAVKAVRDWVAKQKAAFNIVEAMKGAAVPAVEARKALGALEDKGVVRSEPGGEWSYVPPAGPGAAAEADAARRKQRAKKPIALAVAGTGKRQGGGHQLHKEVRQAVEEAEVAGWELVRKGDGHFDLKKGGRKVGVAGSPRNPSGAADLIRRETGLKK